MAKWLRFYATYTFSTSPHSGYRTTLLNTKVLNFTVSQENCEKILSELCPISINLITFSRYMTKYLKLYAWCSKCARSTDTNAETTAPLAAIAAAKIDGMVKASPLVD